MTFPDTALDLRTELLINGTWTDISAYTEHGTVTISRGHPDESVTVSPSAYASTWTDGDGRFSTVNPLGAYYPYLVRNAECRVSVPSQASYMRIENDTTSYAQCPDAAGLHITGDLEIRIDQRPSDYGFAALCGKNSGGSGPSWLLERMSTGLLQFFWWDSGGIEKTVISSVPVPYGRVAIKVTLAVATGTVTFYTAASISGSYTQLGVTFSGTGGAASSVFGGTAVLRVGDNSSASYGNYYGFQLRNGIGGSLAASPDFTAQTAGVTSFTDAQSNTFTLNGTAELSGRNYRGHFEVAELPQTQDESGKTVTVAAAGGGLLRRLGQRTNPLSSAMYRAYTRLAGSLAPVAYWPMEDGANAAQLASALGGPAMTFAGSPNLSSSSAFACSNALPVTNSATFSGPVTGGTWTDNATRFLMAVPGAGEANNTVIASVASRGTIATLTLTYTTGGGLTLIGYDSTGTQLFTSGAVSFGVNGAALRVSMALQNAGGGNLTWSIQTLAPFAATVSASSGTVAGTIGAVTRVQLNPGGGLTQTALGHCSVQSTWDTLFDLNNYVNPDGIPSGALSAWGSEPAGIRFARLCAEEGIAFRGRGDLNATRLMGTQTPQTLTALLQECADADRGTWYETRQVLGFGYITRTALYNQAAAVTLDYAQDHLSMWPSPPKEDDQTIVNDVTVQQSSGGSSARQYAAAGQPVTGGRLSTAAPPAGAGTYDTSVTVNLYQAGDLDSEASWLVHLGTVDQPRYPGILADLANRDLSSLFYQILDMELGDRLVINNPPAWLGGADPVSQLCQQFTETLWTKQLDIAVTGVPELPYEVAVAGTFHADTDGTVVALAASSGATSLLVNSNGPSGVLWSKAGGDVPFDIMAAGERMTVTAVADGLDGGPVTSPGAFANIAFLTVAAGTYLVSWTVTLSGTLSASDVNNFQLYNGSTFVATSTNAGAAGTYPQAAVLMTVSGTLDIKILTNGAGTAGSQYSAAILNPQSFTVTRSVNGVVKAQASGAAVSVYPPVIAAL